LEFEEAALLLIPVGHLDPQLTIDACWRSEGMQVLAWSLGRARLPRYDELSYSIETASKLGFLRDRSESVLANPLVRPLSEIAHGANTYLTVHWRLRQYSISRCAIDFADYVSRCTWGPLTVSELDLIDDDLAIRGERIDRVPEDWYYETL